MDGFEKTRQSEDAELVRAARRGQLDAFAGLVQRYQRQATAVAYRLLSNRDDAMEVTQDAFLKAHEKLASLSEPAQFGPWLLRIVSNLALNRRRSRSLRRTAALDTSGDGGGHDDPPAMEVADPHAATPLAAACAVELDRRLAEAIDKLPPMQREALVLFTLGERPQKEIAQMLGCSVEAVKWHVFTARKKLKEQFREDLQEDAG